MAGSQVGYITLSAVTPQTKAGMDTPLTFTLQANQVTIQNNTTINVFVAFDQPTANGALLVAPNDILVATKAVQTVYLNTASAQNINGVIAPNIVVLGEA